MAQEAAHRLMRLGLGQPMQIERSVDRGARLVIIVTGKGGAPEDSGHWPNERGVLKRLTPQWLREPDLRSVVLGFEEAGRAHGGPGALFVRIRRPSARS